MNSRHQRKLDAFPNRPVPLSMLPNLKKWDKDEPPLIQMGATFRDRWTIKGLIGRGGYGEVYFAVDNETKCEVAFKAEVTVRKNRRARRMFLEQKVLLLLRGRPHVPKIIASGSELSAARPFNFIIMQLLSQNIGDLRRDSPFNRLSQSTVARIAIQAIAGLRDMHSHGYLHRDIKPANMCFGITPYSTYRLLLVDYGLVRRFRNDDGSFRHPRRGAGHRGTPRYFSRRVHENCDACPADDLVSLVYSCFELLLGSLPWKYLDGPNEILRAKIHFHRYDLASYVHAIGVHFQDFCRIVNGFDQVDEPGYDALQELLTPMCHGKKLSDPYDWENGYVDIIQTFEPTDV